VIGFMMACEYSGREIRKLSPVPPCRMNDQFSLRPAPFALPPHSSIANRRRTSPLSLKYPQIHRTVFLVLLPAQPFPQRLLTNFSRSSSPPSCASHDLSPSLLFCKSVRLHCGSFPVSTVAPNLVMLVLQYARIICYA